MQERVQQAPRGEEPVCGYPESWSRLISRITVPLGEDLYAGAGVSHADDKAGRLGLCLRQHYQFFDAPLASVAATSIGAWEPYRQMVRSGSTVLQSLLVAAA